MTTQEATNTVELAELAGERGIPSVNDAGGGLDTRKRAMIVLGLLGFVAIAAALGYYKWSQYQSRKAPGPDPKSLQQSTLPDRTFTNPPALPGPKTDAMPAQSASTPAVETAQVVPAPGAVGDQTAAQGTGMAPVTPVQPPRLDKSAAGLMMATEERGSRSGTGQPVEGAIPTPAGSGSGLGLDVGGDGGGLGAMLSSTRTPMRRATNLGDRNLMIAKGTFIDCALQTRLDSTVPGMTACVVTRNVFSDNGKVLLIERGSTVTGEYQANMRQGMARIFVVWGRIKTPNGVVVDLESPGADALGGGGLPGYVNNHFWKRFGGAIMLSLIDDVAAGVTRRGGNGDGVNFNSTGEAASNVAGEALKNTINIPPTLYKNQGEQVGIYVARDLDFSGVYSVRAD